jgi:hypothetical protein
VYVDGYCERTAPGLWGEPFNAVSNVAFLAACVLLLVMLARQRPLAPPSVWLLPATLGVVGLCSLAFHMLATRATAAMDSLSILVFILTAVVVVVHWMWGVRWRWAWLAAPAYLAGTIGLTAAVVAVGGARAALGGYLPALVGLVGFGLATRRYSSFLLWAAGLFAVSLTLRTLDEPLCPQWPVGTHFLWHCLNATVLFLVSYAVVQRWRSSSGT